MKIICLQRFHPKSNLLKLLTSVAKHQTGISMTCSIKLALLSLSFFERSPFLRITIMAHDTATELT